MKKRETRENTQISNLAVFSPKSFDDVENAIVMLRDGKSIIVYLDKVKEEDAQRVLDLLSGAVFALDGGLYEIKKDIFMLTSGDINVISND